MNEGKRPVTQREDGACYSICTSLVFGTLEMSYLLGWEAIAAIIKLVVYIHLIWLVLLRP